MLKPAFNNRWALFCLFALACAVILPMAFLGIPDSYDLPQHIRFANAYLQTFTSGGLIPQWAPNDNFGLGSVGIRFYPPFAYFLLAGTRWLVGTWYDAFWMNSLFWMFTGCTGVYLWAREWLKVPHAFLAAVLFAVAPFYTFQIYQAVLYSEFAAAGILPFCFLFLTRACRRRDFLSTLLFSICVALLLLTHIPSSVIGLASMAVYALVIIDRRHFIASIGRLSIAFAISLAASAFNWIKLVTEMSWVRHNTKDFASTGFYDYQRYFFPMYLISPETRYVEKMLWMYDLIIVLTLLFFVPSLVFLVLRLKNSRFRSFVRRPHLSLLVSGLFAIFMMSMASSFLWKNISVLPKLQFPWRWLLAATVTGPICAALVYSRLAKHVARRTILYPTIAVILGLSLFAITQNIIPSIPLERSVFNKQISEMDNTEACACWWPIWAKKADDRPEKVSAGSRSVTVDRWAATDRTFTIDAGQPGPAVVSTFWYPYWRATINGSPVEPVPDGTGLIGFPLPAERTEVHVYFEEPWFIGVAAYVSLLTWSAIAITLLLLWRLRKSGPKLS